MENNALEQAKIIFMEPITDAELLEKDSSFLYFIKEE